MTTNLHEVERKPALDIDIVALHEYLPPFHQPIYYLLLHLVRDEATFSLTDSLEMVLILQD